MIIIETKTLTHRYQGTVILELRDDTLWVEAHGEQPRNDDELITWATDVFDVFYIEDVLSIKGE